MTELVPQDAAALGSLTILRKPDARGLVLELAGELDLESAPALDRQLRELNGTSSGRLLIDLSKLEFMDSSGLSVIVDAQRAAEANGHPLSLLPGPAQVQRLFELTGVSERFSFEGER